MSVEAAAGRRTIVLAADDQPFPVVFEMGAQTVVVPARGRISLVVSGPESAALKIGYGENGVSVFRDPALAVSVYDSDGAELDMQGFA